MEEAFFEDVDVFCDFTREPELKSALSCTVKGALLCMRPDTALCPIAHKGGPA